MLIQGTDIERLKLFLVFIHFLSLGVAKDGVNSSLSKLAGFYASLGVPPSEFQHFLPDENGDFLPIAFTAVRAVRQPCLSGPCPILFEKIVSAEGKEYNPKSGIFFCRIPGLYYFTFSATSPASAHFRMALFKNDDEIVSAYGRSDGFSSASNSAVIFIIEGDQVSLQLQEGHLYESPLAFRAYTSFTGFRLPGGLGFPPLPFPFPGIGGGPPKPELEFGQGPSILPQGGGFLEPGPRSETITGHTNITSSKQNGK